MTHDAERLALTLSELVDDDARAMRRAARLRNGGASPQTNQQLARLAGDISFYAIQEDKPAARKGRPRLFWPVRVRHRRRL